jgi:xylulose-5-phosphate/fructose-6-phosphate phosphoketolase
MSKTKLKRQDQEFLDWINSYLRYTDYLGAAMLYLQHNFMLEKPLETTDFKHRILGHWGTVPGINLIYAGLNHLITQQKCEILLITGPGHGAPAILANLFAEQSLYEFYPKRFPLNYNGAGNIMKDFSWPYSGFPSHVTPGVPGSILEGGELGYSLSTAFGAAFDNPNLIVAAIVGDGESESGPLAAAWHSNKFLNPITSGAVLPILHVNGYKISNPTIPSTMSNTELKNLYGGYGYEVLIVEGKNLELALRDALEKAYKKIRAIQQKARKSGKVEKTAWPMIVLRSPKGLRGLKSFKGKQIEGSYRSHGIPLEHPQTRDDEFRAVESWLKSYNVHELIDKNGTPKSSVLKFVPKGKLRMGMCSHAVAANHLKKLKFPKIKKLAAKFEKSGNHMQSSMSEAGKFLRDIFKLNPTNFRLMCPDELESNKLGAIFEQTKRAYIWPLKKTDTDLSVDGRAMEMLSEHTLQGWLQGYLLTGRHGLFVSYEAFTTIIASMVDQYAKFLKQSFSIPWRKATPSANYLLSSVGWRQEHNGYSHQNPSFVSNVLLKHGEFSQIYYPADTNSLLVALEEAFGKTNSINVIVAGKRPLPQWLTLEQAREQAKKGLGIWDFITSKSESKNPDVVLASAGDYITLEALMGLKLAKQICPELKVRYVNVSELNSICVGDYCSRYANTKVTAKDFETFFTKDKPVVFNYHGYVNDLEHIIWNLAPAHRFILHGYSEEGSTTTPFDMAICNQVSRYHVAMSLIKAAADQNQKFVKFIKPAEKQMQKLIDQHHKYIIEHGDDPDEVKFFSWNK